MTSARRNYALNKATKKCEKCADHCESCDTQGGGKCDVCKAGYGWTNDWMCAPCAAGCKDCAQAGAGKCNNCQPKHASRWHVRNCNFLYALIEVSLQYYFGVPRKLQLRHGISRQMPASPVPRIVRTVGGQALVIAMFARIPMRYRRRHGSANAVRRIVWSARVQGVANATCAKWGTGFVCSSADLRRM